jgi:glutathione synthase/RimK-type ligase-like ATP-grasp enzyme
MRDSGLRPRVAIASYAERRPLREDDLPLRDTLIERGLEPVPFVWDDHLPDWAGIDACLIRSVSDYHLKYEEFVEWVKWIGETTMLWNPVEMTLWNADKAYLRDLADAGVPTIATHWLERGSTMRLADLLDQNSWEEAVLKPAVGLGAQDLHKVRRGEPEGQRVLERLFAKQAVLAQPFLPSVPEHGETSLIYIAGELTHTVRKRPGSDDFRVQKTWGGTSSLCVPTAAELGVASEALDCLDPAPLFARVDLVADAASRLPPDRA